MSSDRVRGSGPLSEAVFCWRYSALQSITFWSLSRYSAAQLSSDVITLAGILEIFSQMLVESNVVIIFYMVFDPDIFLACFTCFTLYSEMSHSRSLSRHGPQVTGRLDLSHLPEQAVHPEGLRPPGDLPGLGQELGDEALLTEIPGGAGQAILEVSPVCGEVMCEAELGRSNLDKNYVIKGHGSVGSDGKRVEKSTSLTITPLSSKYYGRYTCKAENSYGVNFHEILLEEAREPSEIQQAVLDKVTATTLQFRFVPPTDIGGLPVDAFAVEYKEQRNDWTQARRRVWPARDVAKGSGYILEDLRPRTTYDLRFGCKNRVGFSVWGARQQITMPRKGRPEPPVLNTDQLGEVGERGEVVELNSSNSYELSWQIPEDNGLPIDYFLLQYYPVRLAGMWGKSMVGYTRPENTQYLIILFYRK